MGEWLRDNWRALGWIAMFAAAPFSIGFLGLSLARYGHRKEPIMVERQVALAVGGIELQLTSEGPGKLKLDKVARNAEEMVKLAEFQQGQLVVGLADGNGNEVAVLHSSEWTITMKPKALRIVFDLRRRPDAKALLELWDIQQALESEDLATTLVVIRPLQVAIDAGAVVGPAVEEFNADAPAGVVAVVMPGEPEGDLKDQVAGMLDKAGVAYERDVEL